MLGAGAADAGRKRSAAEHAMMDMGWRWWRWLESLPCPHARPSWRMCPHCLGLTAGFGLGWSTV